ncbi:hypothetical protein EDC01DRAFT_625166 [Geopyxis carbonaria]|nr:hypothetical protein EDC01DRAFT_625166 [Geopyxis carbonaria]
MADNPLKPKEYHMAGTHPDSRILFLDVNIFDSTGAEPYRGDVLIHGERITHVGHVPSAATLATDPTVRTIHGRGRFLMSGLCDAHTHLTWNGGNLDALGTLGVEEHTLLTARSAATFLSSGYTMCFGAASAKPRLDIVIRDAINAGLLPGPRYLANGQEIVKTTGDLVPGISAYADTPDEMRAVIRGHAAAGVDQVKLSISGENVTQVRQAHECYFSQEELDACVDEAHKLGKRVCTHARARDAVAGSVAAGVDVVYHASYVDAAGLDALEAAKDRTVVAPAINWLYATLYEAAAFGYPPAAAERDGYLAEYTAAVAAVREMRARGITVLPGGDYGFAWTPHGTYARDLQHFVELFGYTPKETLLLATTVCAERLFMRGHELGKVAPGYLADVILVGGNPLEDIAVLQGGVDVVVVNGRVAKCAPGEHWVRRKVGGTAEGAEGAEERPAGQEGWKVVETRAQMDI